MDRDDNRKPLDPKNGGAAAVSVCVCTYKRNILLKHLLMVLQEQVTDGGFVFDVVVVDNDPEKAAEEVVNSTSLRTSLKLYYFHEPVRSISYARNRSIREASGDYIAFIDDDEIPSKEWLMFLVKAIQKYSADGVLGPVEPLFDSDTPKWLVKSGLLDRRRLNTGDIIKDPKHTRTGNVIFKKNLFLNMKSPFDPRYGTVGGGDVEFFERMLKKNKKFVWCDEAVVYEHIEETRKNIAYYIKRAFTRGLTNSIKYPLLNMGTLKSLIAIPVYCLILPISMFSGVSGMIKYSVKICDHLGKILGYLGIQVVKNRPY